MLASLTAKSQQGVTPEAAIEVLAAYLVERGLLDPANLERGRRTAAESGNRLDSVLTQLGLVSELALAEGLAAVMGLKIATPADYPESSILPERLRLKFLRKVRAVPIALDDETITVAMSDPLDRFAISSIAMAAERKVDLLIAVPLDLEAAFERLYKSDEDAGRGLEDVGASPAGADDDAERLKDIASEAPLIRLVNQIISQAVETRASDIHIDPFENQLRIRYRYDGVLHEVEAPPRRLQAAVVSRIKIMASLDIAERRLP
ncbi:MAG TPA: ATPase, T2SS/T4P/T4SS family, partial [Rhizomicrobium sp.]|nr:ATPase, T2SS/T4P/T4SS family [Rhizomicrobium sp.]